MISERSCSCPRGAHALEAASCGRSVLRLAGMCAPCGHVQSQASSTHTSDHLRAHTHQQVAWKHHSSSHTDFAEMHYLLCAAVRAAHASVSSFNAVGPASPFLGPLWNCVQIGLTRSETLCAIPIGAHPPTASAGMWLICTFVCGACRKLSSRSSWKVGLYGLGSPMAGFT